MSIECVTMPFYSSCNMLESINFDVCVTMHH